MTSSHYHFTRDFHAMHQHAVDLYARGQREAHTFFDERQHAFLSSNGLTAQHLYDYAEDFVASGEPDCDQALAIELVRRDYFLNKQKGIPSTTVLDEASLPAKSAAVAGIEWLPRLIPKARAKLRGELPSSLMYCCGGDRRFFKQHDILPAEFLSLLWRQEHDDQAVIAWVAARSKSPAKG
jgi:hypothetical protein